ncbi:hypothetical protein HYDPIDRAFT_119451 [Hydnomerulius pinastri MD-312]|uniref:C2H2-type domain-containing protein n=1 Tax=Hydnomerulius pinastri MD-312 TaxID=994086 RepID=A0A0C9W7N9_9AGAM|nr:hypothetical protein HYDPIDRAFT_119451 [Hydnomerulius pinastri MD-312]
MDVIEYNQSFGDKESVDFIANVLDSKFHTCLWLDGEGSPCNQVLEAKDFNAHLRSTHGLTAPSGSYPCCWYGCSSLRGAQKRPGLERHVQEIHLEYRWPCGRCDQVFTRKANLKSHLAGCPYPGNGGNN